MGVVFRDGGVVVMWGLEKGCVRDCSGVRRWVSWGGWWTCEFCGFGQGGAGGGRFVFRESGACLKRVCGVSEWVCEGVFRGGGRRRRVGKTGVRFHW